MYLIIIDKIYCQSSVRKERLERQPFGYGKVTFTRPFLMLGKLTFDEYNYM